jgi:site-specific recombinase XerC
MSGDRKQVQCLLDRAWDASLFATDLVQPGYDIRTVQGLLGDADVRTRPLDGF